MGQIMVKNDVLRPTAFLMATLALFSFLSVMHVVAQVAVMAFQAQFFFVQFTAVACRASQFGMLAFEGELGVLIVIELCVLPAVFCVAGITLLAVTPSMLVIIFVAVVAVLFRFDVGYSFFVTGFADGLFVFAF